MNPELAATIRQDGVGCESCHGSSGAWLGLFRRPDEADRLLERAYTIESELAKHSNHLEIRKGLATTCQNLGITKRKLKFPPEKVMPFFRQAFEIYRQLAADFDALARLTMARTGLHD